jgi:hypothetical protein
MTYLAQPSPLSTPGRSTAGHGSPTIQILPGQGYAGVYLQVTGDNWPINSLVLVTLVDDVGRSGILAASTVDGNGQLSTGFLYPVSPRWLTPGPHTVLAYTSDGNLQTTTQFVVVPPGGEGTGAATATAQPAMTSTSTATRTPGSPPAQSTSTPTPTTSPTPTPTASPTPTPTAKPTRILITDWRGEYWSNPNLSGAPDLVRNDAAIVFDWSNGSPDSAIPADHFSARWTRTLTFDPGLYRFTVEVDDGARLFIDGVPVVDEWQAGPLRTFTVIRTLDGGPHFLELDYFESNERAVVRFWWERQETFTGWESQYFDNPNLAGDPVLITDEAAIDFAWGAGSPGPALPVDGFSARWVRTVAFQEGRYRLYARADDGIRVWIDQELVLDEWHDSAGDLYTVDVELLQGVHRLQVEYYEHTGAAQVEFRWEWLPAPTPTHTPTWTPTGQPTGRPTLVPVTPSPTS